MPAQVHLGGLHHQQTSQKRFQSVSIRPVKSFLTARQFVALKQNADARRGDPSPYLVSSGRQHAPYTQPSPRSALSSHFTLSNHDTPTSTGSASTVTHEKHSTNRKNLLWRIPDTATATFNHTVADTAPISRYVQHDSTLAGKKNCRRLEKNCRREERAGRPRRRGPLKSA